MNLTPIVVLLAALVSGMADVPDAARESRLFLHRGKQLSGLALRRIRTVLGSSTKAPENTKLATAKQKLMNELHACNPERHDTSFEEYRPS